jgi:hypothetical protein
MSFRHEALYLVEPLPALADRLSGWSDDDFAAVLLDPRLFRRVEVSGSAWLHDDRLVQAKLLFLASLREYTPLQESAGFAAVFGSPVISVEVFDRWFRVRRFEVEQEMDLLEARLRECPLTVEATGRQVVDWWLSQTRETA